MRNERIIYEYQYQGHLIMTDKAKQLGCKGSILQKIDQIMTDMSNRHSKVYFMRFDIRFPQGYDCPNDNELFSQFQESFIKNRKRAGYDPALQGFYVYGVKVLGGVQDLEEIYRKTPFDKVIITTDLASREKVDLIYSFCQEHKIEITKFCLAESKDPAMFCPVAEHRDFVSGQIVPSTAVSVKTMDSTNIAGENPVQ